MNKIEQIRSQMPATTNIVYLNTGSVGPMANVTRDTLHAAVEHESQYGRASIRNFLHIKAQTPLLRAQMGAIMGVSGDDIALTHHTTDGMNIVIHSFPWQPGDGLMLTNWEHQGGYLPAFTAARKNDLTIEIAHLDWHDSAADITAKIIAAITPRTRLILLSHIMWNTGIQVDLTAIVTAAHAKNVLVLVDGAQSMGSIPLDLPATGVDFYAVPGQKWLCGPEGVGALYVRPDRLNLLQPQTVGYRGLSAPDAYDLSGNWLPQPNASRFEIGTAYRPAIYAMQANLDWLANAVGWEWIHERISSLTAYAWQKLNALDCVNMITHENAGSGLITFDLVGYDPARVNLALIEQNIVIRYLMQPYALRAAVGFYNNEADIDRLTAALAQIATLDPESLPVVDY